MSDTDKSKIHKRFKEKLAQQKNHTNLTRIKIGPICAQLCSAYSLPFIALTKKSSRKKVGEYSRG